MNKWINKRIKCKNIHICEVGTFSCTYLLFKIHGTINNNCNHYFTEVEVNSGGYLLSLRQDKYSPLFTNTEVNNIVLVYTKPVNSKGQKINVIWSKLGWKHDHSCKCPLCFANQWISQDIPSLSSQSECTKMDIHWFGAYTLLGCRDCQPWEQYFFPWAQAPNLHKVLQLLT